MSKNYTLEEFWRDHPLPETEGQTSLFKFSKIDMKQRDHLEDLFIHAKLYMALPAEFNDPFECLPVHTQPLTNEELSQMRQDVIKRLKQEEPSLSSADLGKKATKIMKAFHAWDATKVYRKLRICCFTKEIDNLLFWAHYADKHKGFCLEYAATSFPISIAKKVKYSDSRPEVSFPSPRDERAFQPALIKSSDWGYEDEYRITNVPGVEKPSSISEEYRSKDGEFCHLQNSAIKKIYFGANIDPDDKESIKELIRQGPFNPTIWQAKLSKSNFKLEFFPEST